MLDRCYPHTLRKNQSGINMVDLMMWIVIAALLLAAAIQGGGYYQKAAFLYHMKSDLSGAGEITMSKVADNGGTLNKAAVDLGTSETKWSKDVAYEVRTSTNPGAKPYIVATHPGVPDLDAIYIFEDCGNKYAIGVNVIPKNGNVDLAACGITPSDPVAGGGGTVTPPPTGALSNTGLLASWGYGQNGELGNGPLPSTTTYGALYNKNVSSISAGSGNPSANTGSSCVVAEGKAYCWGSNGSGQLGTGDTTFQPNPTPVAGGAMTGKTVTAIETRDNQTCAIADGGAYCWGGLNLPEGVPALGDGTNNGSAVPVAVTGLAGKTVTKIVPSDSMGVVDTVSQTCALISDGTVYCWGRNNDGTLGNGNRVSSKTPVLVTGALTGKTVTDLSGSRTDSSFTYCAVANNAPYCWGDGSSGQLGRGSYSGSISPVAVTTSGALSGKTVTRVSLGDTFACAVASGKAYCWGTGNGGAIGDGNGSYSLVPVAVGTTGVLSGKTVTQIAAGGQHACALTGDAGLYCWGASSDYSGSSPILGDGTFGFQSYSPVAVKMDGGLKGLTPTAISAGPRFSCTVASNAAYCWGADPTAVYTASVNYDYSAASIASPGKVGGSTSFSTMTVTKFSAGANHSCAVSSGQAYCWGANGSGEVGNGGTDDVSAPVLVDSSGALAGKTVTDIAAGSSTSCAVADGKAYCWGDGSNGQLGDGAGAPSSVPVAVDSSGVLSGKKIVAVATGSAHSCAVDDANKIYCWGANWSQQLGNGTGTDSNVPVAVDMSGVPANAAITKITSAIEHTCVIAGGDPYCWGSNWIGQLGNGSTSDASKPVAVNVSGIAGASGKTTDIDASDTTCAVINAAAYCWGKNNSGELGSGTASNWNSANTLPVAVNTSAMSSPVSGINVGDGSACAVSMGKGYCWGYGGYGTLGQGEKVDSLTPVPVDVSGTLAGKNLTGISLGGSTSFATYE